NSQYSIYLSPPNFQCYGLSGIGGRSGGIIDAIQFEYYQYCTNYTFWLSSYSDISHYFGSDGTAFRYLNFGRIFEIHWGMVYNNASINILSFKSNGSNSQTISKFGKS